MTLEELKEVFSVLDPKVQNSPMAAEVREEIAIRERVRPGQPAPDFRWRRRTEAGWLCRICGVNTCCWIFGLRGVALAGLRSPK